jgi:GT2 family glycosyltransferase
MRLSLIIVCYGEDVGDVLARLDAQRAPGDEIIVVDNLSADGGTPGVRGHPAVDRLIEPEGNLHYAPGMNLGASAATGDAVVLLNPDALPADGFLDALRDPPPDWDGWTAVLTLPDGEHVNNAGGVVHFTGLAWSGRFGEHVGTLPRDPYESGFLSGGGLAVRRATWEELGGYPDHYGVYHEDTELSLRMRLAGKRFGVVPRARTAHDYDFVKGPGKWRNLERNRWMTLLRTYPAALLLLILPALLALEVALLVVAAKDGWLEPKLQAYADLLRWLPRMPAERRAVQARATVDAPKFAAGLEAEPSSPFLGAAGRSPALRAALRAYWSAVQALLRLAA